jgi:hypothetical protein
MALQDEITRIKQAKADIKSSIEAKGGTVGDGTIDTYASAIDNLPSGGGSADFEITNASYLFREKARLDILEDLISLISNKCTNFYYMFQGCNDQKFIPPYFNTSYGTSFNYMFGGCTYIKTIPHYDTSRGTNFSYMFNGCSALTEIPELDVSKGTNFNSTFNNCAKLKEMPSLNTAKGTNLQSMFNQCYALEKAGELKGDACGNLASIFNGCSELVEFDGIANLGKSYIISRGPNYYNYQLNLSSCTKLNHDSLMNVINKLYDIKSAGIETQKLVLGSTILSKLTAEEINIAVEKGWSVS